MKICDKCSVANDDRAAFCTGCGAILPKKEENPISSYNDPVPVTEKTSTEETYTQAPKVTPVGVPSPVVQPVTPPRPAFVQPPVQPPYGYAINPNALPVEYQPVTIGEYLLYGIGFGIPFVGIILMLVTAFGNGKKISLKNYAKSYLIMYAIGVVLCIVATLAFAFLRMSMYDY